MSRLPLCYFASPYGFAPSTDKWYYETYLPRFKRLVEVRDPWCVPLPPKAHNSNPIVARQGWIELGTMHYNAIRQCDMLIAALDQEPPDNGTVSELTFAYGIGLPVIAYRGDLRTSSESGMPYNLMISAAARNSGGFESDDLDELVGTQLPRFIENYFAD